MASSNEYKFMQQQGFKVGDEPSAKSHFTSLLFQPRIVGGLIVIATIFQSGLLFLILGIVLWFNAIFPVFNPFERTYDALFGKRKGYPPLPPAPMPRRFMQGMAGTLCLLAAIFILLNWNLAAYITEAFILIAFALLLFGKFCLGAYIYHALKGNISFANATSPWKKSPEK